jgi:hypothetical protein
MKPNNKSARGSVLTRALPILSVLLLGASAAHAASYGYLTSGHPPSHRAQRVDLGGAGHFVILTETGITDVPASAVVGNVGVSPITGAADLLSCAEVTGKVYSVDASGPQPCNIVSPRKLTNAVGDMQAAYTDAAGRTANVLNLHGGYIGGLTLAPGVYSWDTDVNVASNVTLKGDSHGVWIFQTSGNFIVATGASVMLGGHAQAQNIFWQVAGATTVGTSAHLEGILLDATSISMGTGASINGRLLAQTALTLQMNSITVP